MRYSLNRSFAQTRRLSAASLAAAAGLVLAASAANAVVIDWAAAGNGVWNVNGNWSGGNIPDTGVEDASLTPLGSYTVTQNGNYAIGALILPTGGGNLQIASGFFLQPGSITNNRTINVNDGVSGGSTYLQASGNGIAINGTGSLVMNATASLDTAYLWYGNSGAFGFTNGAGHTIRGTGNIYCPITNNGTVNADQNGKVLQMWNQPKTNNSLMTATNGGILQFTNQNYTQGTSGQIVANGGIVRYDAIGLFGGAVSTINGGTSVLRGGSTFSDVTISGPFTMNNGSILAIQGDGIGVDGLTNNGTISVNDGVGAGATYIQSNSASQQLNGTGTIILNANASSLDTAYLWYGNSGVNGFTQAATHTIRGTGNIYCPITNNGVINADQNGRTLQLFNQNKVNNSLMTATNGGILNFSAAAYTQGASGQIVANTGSSVLFGNMGLTGGQVVATGAGGLCSLYGASTFDSVTLSGPFNINNGANLYVSNVLTNNGTITINNTAGAGASILRANAANTPINGTGTIVLNANTGGNLDTAYLYWNGSGVQGFTIGSGQTVRGTGNVYCPITNNGTFNADRSGLTMQFQSQPKTNNALWTATGGGILQFADAAYTQSGTGQIVADVGSRVRFGSMGVTGGVVRSVGTGFIELYGNSTIDSITFSGAFKINNGQNLYVASSGFVNNGTITVNDTAGISASILHANAANTPITGTGTIVLNANAGNLDTSYILWTSSGTEGFTFGSGQTVRGTGSIYCPITNNGTVNADVSGRTLQFVSQPKTNNALWTATGGGIMQFTDAAYTQSGTGQIVADVGSRVRFGSVGVTGGVVRSVGTGFVELYGSSTIDSITLSGNFKINSAASLYVAAAGFTNNGVVTVNDGVSGAAAVMRANTAAVPLNGTGTVLLNANPANLATAYLIYAGSGTQGFRNTTNHSIAGLGQIYCPIVNNGRITPGYGATPIGRIDLQGSGSITCTSTSNLDFNIGGTAPAQFDRLTGVGSVVLAGRINVSIVNGFVPTIGQTFDVISGPAVSGRFTSATLPRLWAVTYGSNFVRLSYTGCVADGDDGFGTGIPDAGVGIEDLLLYLADYDAGSLRADVDDGSNTGTTDGGVGIEDLLYYLSRFDTGC